MRPAKKLLIFKGHNGRRTSVAFSLDRPDPLYQDWPEARSWAEVGEVLDGGLVVLESNL